MSATGWINTQAFSFSETAMTAPLSKSETTIISLPLEVRLCIYELVFKDIRIAHDAGERQWAARLPESDQSGTTSRSHSSKNWNAMLLVSRQIYLECCTFLRTHSTLVIRRFKATTPNPALDHLLGTVYKNVRRLELHRSWLEAPFRKDLPCLPKLETLTLSGWRINGDRLSLGYDSDLQDDQAMKQAFCKQEVLHALQRVDRWDSDSRRMIALREWLPQNPQIIIEYRYAVEVRFPQGHKLARKLLRNNRAGFITQWQQDVSYVVNDQKLYQAEPFTFYEFDGPRR